MLKSTMRNLRFDIKNHAQGFSRASIFARTSARPGVVRLRHTSTSAMVTANATGRVSNPPRLGVICSQHKGTRAQRDQGLQGKQAAASVCTALSL